MRSKQYTIRNIPDHWDRTLRQWARDEGKSHNAMIVEILQEACGLNTQPRTHHDLDSLIGT